MLANQASAIQSARMRWYALHVVVRDADTDRAQLLLHENGSTGVEIRTGARLVAWFRRREDAERARGAVRREMLAARTRLTSAADRDWANEWRRHVRPVRVGRLWIGPSWLRARAPRGAVALTIEPGMAFGTGDHPTTRLCLEAVEAFCATRDGASVLDIGTGSGLLALVASALGASRVTGIDNDPVAVATARANARVNGLGAVRFSGTPLHRVRGTFDLVVANLTAAALVPLARELLARTRGRLALCGIRSRERFRVESAYASCGLSIVGRATRRGWVRLDFEPTR